MKFFNFINELNDNNSSNYKLQILQKYKEDKDIFNLLRYTYDKVQYTFNIQMTNISINKHGNKEFKLDDLIPLKERKYTGNSAIQYLQDLFNNYSKESQFVCERVISRDLKCGINIKSINKVFKNCILELPYMRCSLIDSISNIKFPAFLQEKMDGTYRSIIVDDKVEAFSRSAEEYKYPKLFKDMKNLECGVYIGELLVDFSNENLNAQDFRFKSNGLLNSDNVPDNVIFYVWDFLTIDEFKNGFSEVPYNKRLEILQNNIKNSQMVKLIENTIVNDLEGAMEITKKYISEGKEGSILKNLFTPFENKTSKNQIKLKNEFDIDVEITGFTKGSGKRANTFGSITFKSSDGKLEGQCSGFTDELLEKINSNKENYIGKIMTVKATDVSKAKRSETYNLTFPRFVCIREDKTCADSLERIFQSLNGSKSINKVSLEDF